MKNITEKLAILSLSLMLVSTYSISAVLPSMLGYFDKLSPSQVDILISIPSFAIMIMILIFPSAAPPRYLSKIIPLS